MSPKQVEIWSLALDQVAPSASRKVLDAAERQRAARFRNARDGARWAAARAGLRALVGARLGRDPRSARFEVGKLGKPAVVDSGGLRFSVTHSHGLALYALAHGREVGVDLEAERPGIDVGAVSRRVLPRTSVRALAELPVAERRSAFFAHWTRHEATLKCIGTGLGERPAREPNVIIAQLELGPGWAGAVAVEGIPPRGGVRQVPLADEEAAPSLGAAFRLTAGSALDHLLRLRATLSLG